MAAYEEAYLGDVVETQGKLFDLVAQTYPDCDTRDFITTYMCSKTRASIDRAMAYVCTMDAMTLWDYFIQTEGYAPVPGVGLDGFMVDWLGEFYAYYQWCFDEPSANVLESVPLDFLMKAYPGLHDLELDLAVQKVGRPDADHVLS